MLTLKIREVRWLTQVLLQARAPVRTPCFPSLCRALSRHQGATSKSMTLEKKGKHQQQSHYSGRRDKGALIINPAIQHSTRGSNTVISEDKERKWKKRKQENSSCGVLLITYRSLGESAHSIYTYKGRTFFFHGLSREFGLPSLWSQTKVNSNCSPVTSICVTLSKPNLLWVNGNNIYLAGWLWDLNEMT